MIDLLLAAVIWTNAADIDPNVGALDPTMPLKEAPPEPVEREQPVSRGNTRPVPPPVPSNVTLDCIGDHETYGSTHPYTEVNEYGYAGRYQLSPDYADDWARRYGYGEWADVPVVQWPPAVQDAVALALGLDTGWTPWSDPRWSTYTCPGF